MDKSDGKRKLCIISGGTGPISKRMIPFLSLKFKKFALEALYSSFQDCFSGQDFSNSII